MSAINSHRPSSLIAPATTFDAGEGSVLPGTSIDDLLAAEGERHAETDLIFEAVASAYMIALTVAVCLLPEPLMAGVRALMAVLPW